MQFWRNSLKIPWQVCVGFARRVSLEIPGDFVTGNHGRYPSMDGFLYISCNKFLEESFREFLLRSERNSEEINSGISEPYLARSPQYSFENFQRNA